MGKMIVELKWSEDLGTNWVTMDILDCVLHTNTHLNRGNVEIADITERCTIDQRKSEVLSELISSHDL